MLFPKFFNRAATAPASTESRSIENPEIPISDSAILDILGGLGPTIADVNVTTETALGVPAVFAAVNFISGTLAGLPMGHFKKVTETIAGEKKPGRKKLNTPLSRLFSRAANDEWASFPFRKKFFENVLLEGRGLIYIERTPARRPVNLFLLDVNRATIARKNHRTVYKYKQPSGQTVTYQAADVIDLWFMLKNDCVTALSPILTNRETIGVQIAAQNYGARFFAGGGVPPLVIQGNFLSAKALKNAAADLWASVVKAGKEKRNALTLPLGMDAKPIGVDPEKAQLEKVLRFGVEQVARMYSLPPNFVQDLSNGTFNNTEQQDVQLVKHTLRRWVEHFEQEINLKVFGRSDGREYIEHNMDGIQRGDFKTRMDGYQAGVNSGVLMPSEAREKENRPFVEGTDRAFIQGAMIPIARAGEHLDTNQAPPEPLQDKTSGDS